MADNNRDFQELFGRQSVQQQHQGFPPLAPQQHSHQEENPQKKRGKKRNAVGDAAGNTSNVANNAAGASNEAAEDPASAMVFPVKLHRMLTLIDDVQNGRSATSNPTTNASGSNAPPHETEEDPASIVSWQPHGRCFLVHDKEAFVQRFLPSYFRQSKWASFQRQLNIYGFQRLTAGRDRGAYYHDMFVRGHPDLATRIQRMKLKGIGQGRHRTNAELEPNFYRMTPIDHTTPVPVPTGATNKMDNIHRGQHSGAPAAQAQAAANTPSLNNVNTVNLLQLFQGQNGGGASPAASNQMNVANSQAMGGQGQQQQQQQQGGTTSLSGMNQQDLSNLFFLTNAGDLSALQQSLGNGGGSNNGSSTGGRGGSQQQQQQLQQDGNQQSQSTQQALMLANLFNGTNGGGGGGNNNATNSTNTNSNSNNQMMQQLLQQDNSGVNNNGNDQQQQYANLLGNTNSSNLMPLLQSAAGDTSGNANPFLNTAALMQYFSENGNSPDRQEDNTPPALSNHSNRQQQQQPQSQSQQQANAWASLAAASGFNNNDANNNNASGNNQNFQFERRMSAAAMNSLLSAHLGGNSSAGGSAPAPADNSMGQLQNNNSMGQGQANNLFGGGDSNPNLLLFSTLHNSRNMSSNNLLFPSWGENTNTTNSSNNNNGASNNNGQGQMAASPASQQLALLNAAAASGNHQGLLYTELSRAVNAGVNVTHPTFLDSVYEPIPIKENGATNHPTVGRIGHNGSPDGSDSGQQHKLSPQNTGAGQDPSKRFLPRFPDSHQR